MAYSKTASGQQAFKERTVTLTPRQRAAFILFDGKRSLANVLAATAGLGVTTEDIEYLIATHMLIGTPGVNGPIDGNSGFASASISTQPVAVVPTEVHSDKERYQKAYLIATQLTAGLGLRGFRLNLAVEGVSGYEELLALAPKIREAVGPEKYRALDQALHY